MPIGDLQELVVLDPDRIHEIAVATAEPDLAPDAARRLSGVLDVPARPIVVASWVELNPVLAEYVALADSLYWIFIIVIFAIASFGIANTMLMATFERRREFAVMLALGSSPWSIVGSVLYEALAIGLVSLALGAAVTAPLMTWFYLAPPSLAWLFGNVTLQGALMTPTLRVGYNVPAWTAATIGLILTALIAAFYPAIRAARVPPADTLSGL